MTTHPKSLIQRVHSIRVPRVLGLGLSTASLGLGVVNFNRQQQVMGNSHATAVNTQKQVEFEQKSFQALQKIHKALQNNPER